MDRQRVRIRRLRGSTAIEFALVLICVVPLFFGSVAIGLTVGNGVEATQVTSDVGRMYGDGTDFTSAAAQQLVTSLAQGYSLTATGNAVMIMSQITTVFAADCTNASVSPCTNAGSPVFTQRVVIGNSSLKRSAFGTPPSTYVDSLGNISAANYMTQTTLVANGFSSVLAQSDGDVAYVVEDIHDAWHQFPGSALSGQRCDDGGRVLCPFHFLKPRPAGPAAGICHLDGGGFLHARDSGGGTGGRCRNPVHDSDEAADGDRFGGAGRRPVSSRGNDDATQIANAEATARSLGGELSPRLSRRFDAHGDGAVGG